MSERYFQLFTAFMNPNIYLAVRDENHALRFEANFTCAHAVWENPYIEFHCRVSKTQEDEHVCGLFGEDSCSMHHTEALTIEFSNKCCDALNLDGTDKVYEMLESVWEKRPEWMKETI